MPPPAKRELGGQLSDILERLIALENRSRPAPVPAGVLRIFAGSETPAGWLDAAGGVYDPELYPDLYKAIGTTYGGTPTAPLLPDARGRALVGVDPAQTEFSVVGKTGGAKTHTLTAAELANHVHNFGGDDQIGSQGGYPSIGSFPYDATSTVSGGGKHFVTGGVRSPNAPYTEMAGQPHNNLSPYLTVRIIIKA